MKKFKFLVFIDDDKATNIYHRFVVKESGLCETFEFFTSAYDALTFFESLSQKDAPLVPDAIFLDINMPGMNGWDFLEKYEQLNIKKSPSIIMLSTSLFALDREKAENMDIVHRMINKPLESQHLMEILKELNGEQEI